MKKPIDLLTPDQVARMFNLKKRAVIKLVADRELPHYRLGYKIIRFKQEELETAINKYKISKK